MSSLLHLGFVPIREIQNVFTEKMRSIEQDLIRQGIPANHKNIIEMIDDIRLALHQRAETNILAFMKENPEAKKIAHQKKAEAKAETLSADPQVLREERLKAHRAEAIREALKG